MKRGERGPRTNFWRIGAVSRRRTPSQLPLVVTMRVKNEERILPRCLESLRPLDCPVILLDDGSTDRTEEIAKSFSFVSYHPQIKPEMNELRDRTWLFHRAMNMLPEWVLTVDGDEVLPRRTAGKLNIALANAPEPVNIIELAIAFMWGEDRYVDFETGPFWHPRAYRASHADAERPYKPIEIKDGPKFDHGLHCGPLPPLVNAWTPMKVYGFIKAYGYDTPEDYRRHFEFYDEYDKTLWSQRQIVDRLSEPLAAWSDDLIPSETSDQRQLESLRYKLEKGLAAWGDNEQGEGTEETKDVPEKRRPGRPRKHAQAGPGSSTREARC